MLKAKSLKAGGSLPQSRADQRCISYCRSSVSVSQVQSRREEGTGPALPSQTGPRALLSGHYWLPPHLPAARSFSQGLRPGKDCHLVLPLWFLVPSAHASDQHPGLLMSRDHYSFHPVLWWYGRLATKMILFIKNWKSQVQSLNIRKEHVTLISTLSETFIPSDSQKWSSWAILTPTQKCSSN
jgi:hypothetical protein